MPRGEKRVYRNPTYHTPQLELSGFRSGKLVAVEKVGPSPDKRIMWRCRCDCGNETVAAASSLKSGLNKSCGCLRSSPKGSRHTGRSKLPEYGVWSIMRQRCNNPRDDGYYLYGARGIKVCPEWDRSDGFAAFIAHIGPRPPGRYSVDRIDNSRGYEPGNVRWATPREQSANTRQARLETINGETRCVSEWCRRYGVRVGLVNSRLRMGWPIEAALTWPRSTSWKDGWKRCG